MGLDFNCCTEFLPLRTEFGLCFSLNSLQTTGQLIPDYVSNLETGPGLLQFHSTEDVQVYIHPPLELPTQLTEGVIQETVLWGTKKEIIINIMEIYNEPGVESLNPKVRRCRFPSELGVEVDSRFFNFYSASTCVSQCTIVAQIALCDCVSHVVYISDNNTNVGLKTCDIEGLLCLDANYQKLYNQRFNCECPMSCDEPVYNIIYNSPEE